MTEHNESEYQDLIEEFLAKGGKITRCEDGKAEGALELDKQQPSMNGLKPNDAQQWDDYFDMTLANQFDTEGAGDARMKKHVPIDVPDKVNQIKRVVK